MVTEDGYIDMEYFGVLAQKNGLNVKNRPPDFPEDHAGTERFATLWHVMIHTFVMTVPVSV